MSAIFKPWRYFKNTVNKRYNRLSGSFNQGTCSGTVFALGLKEEPMMQENEDMKILSEFFGSPENVATYLEHMMHKRNAVSDKAQLLASTDVTWRDVAQFMANLARGNRRIG